MPLRLNTKLKPVRRELPSRMIPREHAKLRVPLDSPQSRAIRSSCEPIALSERSNGRRVRHVAPLIQGTKRRAYLAVFATRSAVIRFSLAAAAPVAQSRERDFGIYAGRRWLAAAPGWRPSIMISGSRGHRDDVQRPLNSITIRDRPSGSSVLAHFLWGS